MHSKIIQFPGGGYRIDAEDTRLIGLVNSLVQFPDLKTSGTIEDIIFNQIIGTKKTRQGGCPPTYVQDNIRAVIAGRVRDKLPIPILVPWGSVKPQGARGPDIAELMGIMHLVTIARNIKAIYSPGVDMRIRVEDIGGNWLFRDEIPDYEQRSMDYVTTLYRMMFALVPKGIWVPKVASALRIQGVSLIPESLIINQYDHDQTARRVVGSIYYYLMRTEGLPEEEWESQESYQALVDAGWLGNIPREMRDYYYSLYEKYGHTGIATKAGVLSRYLAGSYARHMLRATGFPKGFPHIQINFASMVPGANATGLRNTTVYHRTVSTDITRNHIPPWRAFGDFRYTEDGKIVPALRGYSGDVNLEAWPKITITNDDFNSFSIPSVVW